MQIRKILGKVWSYHLLIPMTSGTKGENRKALKVREGRASEILSSEALR
jgi:hypothetical protein